VPAPSLPELQRLFWQSLAREPGTLDGRALEPRLVEVIAPSATLGSAERLQIYAGMYFHRLRDALREDFPRLAARLGPAGFDALVAAYVRHHPSGHPSLRDLGRELPDFIARHPRAEMPVFLADLARLEWARVEVFDAPDRQPLTAADLAAVPPEEWPGLRFTAIAALQVVRSEWPVHDIWESPTGEHARRPTTVRVWREGWTVYHARVEAEEAQALGHLVAGEPFARLCEAFAHLPPAEAAGGAAGLLARWLADGLVASAR
jgi:hypothetical protein